MNALSGVSCGATKARVFVRAGLSVQRCRCVITHTVRAIPAGVHGNVHHHAYWIGPAALERRRRCYTSCRSLHTRTHTGYTVLRPSAATELDHLPGPAVCQRGGFSDRALPPSHGAAAP